MEGKPHLTLLFSHIFVMPFCFTFFFLQICSGHRQFMARRHSEIEIVLNFFYQKYIKIEKNKNDFKQ